MKGFVAVLAYIPPPFVLQLTCNDFDHCNLREGGGGGAREGGEEGGGEGGGGGAGGSGFVFLNL